MTANPKSGVRDGAAMTARTLWVPLLLLAAALSGCTASPDDATTQATDSTPDGEETDSIEAPAWHVGQIWTWSDNFGYDMELVVTAVDGPDYIVDTTSDLEAFEEQAWDHPALGSIRASDLALTTGEGETATWFQFPLEDGATWSVDWYGSTYSVVAEAQPDGRFYMQALRDDGTVYVDYHYSEAVGWFDDYTYYDEDGEVTYAVDATLERDFTGQVVRADVTEVFADEGEGPHQNNQGFDLSDASDDSQLYGMVYLFCQQGAASISFGNAEGAGGMGNLAAVCPGSSFHSYGAVDADPKQGNWGVILNIASPDAQWGAWVWLAEYERFPVGGE